MVQRLRISAYAYALVKTSLRVEMYTDEIEKLS